MREEGIAEVVLAAIERRAAGHRVRRAKVRVGVLLRVDPAALSHAFLTVSDGTVADGAHLDVTIDPVRLTCGVCDRTITADGLLAACPTCGGTDLAIDGGDGLVLESVALAETAGAPGASRTDPGGTAGPS
jgi:hydrogenase nickel incorporation protein HypA/HybF